MGIQTLSKTQSSYFHPRTQNGQGTCCKFIVVMICDNGPPGNITRGTGPSHVIHKIWGSSQGIVHTWLRCVVPGIFTEQSISQNPRRQGAGKWGREKPIKFRGVHGGIIKSQSQSPKVLSGHKMEPYSSLYVTTAQQPASHLGPAPEAHFTFSLPSLHTR